MRDNKNSQKKKKEHRYNKETIKKINEFKKGVEGNIVSIIYNYPEFLYETNLDRDDFTTEWKVFYGLAYRLIIVDRKKHLDVLTIDTALQSLPTTAKYFYENGGFELLETARTYAKDTFTDNVQEAFDGYVSEFHKWNALINIAGSGYQIDDRLEKYAKMPADEIAVELQSILNESFINTEERLKLHNACSGMRELVDNLDAGMSIGMPLANADMLTEEIGGILLDGQIYGIGAGTGVGKSTMVMNWLIPTVIENNGKIVFFINEEDKTKVQKEMLIWCVNNIFNERFSKRTLRNGHYTQERKEILYKAVEWFEELVENRNIIVIELPRYSARLVSKYMKILNKSEGVRLFVLDTLKESFDSDDPRICDSMMRDMVMLYDTIKPNALNVALVVTFQLTKGAWEKRFLTVNNIGQAKSIADTMSCIIMMRPPYEDEFDGGKNVLICERIEGENTRIPFKMDKNKRYMITFLTKTRFGERVYQIVSESNMSTNIYKDIGICRICQDI